MENLLDRFAAPATTLRPSNAVELFCLRLAQKLGEPQAARHYLGLANSHSQARILCAYARTRRSGQTDAIAKRFHVELNRIQSNGYHDQPARLLAIRVERRTIAAAILDGDRLEFTDARQLSSSPDKALASTMAFTNWLLQYFSVESAVLEAIPNGHEFQRRTLNDAIRKTLRDRMLPIWEVSRPELLEGYGFPALKSREALREVATTIWPVLSGTRAKVFIQDAAVLGLHVQIERLFIINS